MHRQRKAYKETWTSVFFYLKDKGNQHLPGQVDSFFAWTNLPSRLVLSHIIRPDKVKHEIKVTLPDSGHPFNFNRALTVRKQTGPNKQWLRAQCSECRNKNFNMFWSPTQTSERKSSHFQHENREYIMEKQISTDFHFLHLWNNPAKLSSASMNWRWQPWPVSITFHFSKPRDTFCLIPRHHQARSKTLPLTCWTTGSKWH